MKAKIVAISTDRSIKIRFQEMIINNKKNNGLNFWGDSCFGLCVVGILDDGTQWHTNALNAKQREQISLLNSKGLDDGDFEFNELREICQQRVSYIWDQGEPLKQFKEIFEKNDSGGYLVALKFSDDTGHTLALKYRNESWLFMDPDIRDVVGKKGYIHGKVSDDGFINANGEPVPFIGFIFSDHNCPDAYIVSMGVVNFLKNNTI